MTTIALDFDGVLSQYDGDFSHPPGPPVLGAKQFVEQLQKKATVVIFSSRDAAIIRPWLARYGFPPLEIYYKPPVLAIVDDRAVRFRGSFDLSQEIFEKPWWQKKEG